MLKKIARIILRDELFDLENGLNFYKRMYKLESSYRDNWVDSIHEAYDKNIINHEQFAALYKIKGEKTQKTLNELLGIEAE